MIAARGCDGQQLAQAVLQQLVVMIEWWHLYLRRCGVDRLLIGDGGHKVASGERRTAREELFSLLI
jgi:hypothetical protein